MTKTFHEHPERLQSDLTRAEAVFVDAMLGRFWDGGGAPVRPPELGRAARDAGFAVRLWEPQANASEDFCHEPVLRLVKQCISQGKVWAAFFCDLHLAPGPKLQAQRLERQRTLARLVPFRQPFCTTTGALKWRCNWLNDCTIVKSRLWNTLRPVCFGRLPSAFASGVPSSRAPVPVRVSVPTGVKNHPGTCRSSPFVATAKKVSFRSWTLHTLWSAPCVG